MSTLMPCLILLVGATIVLALLAKSGLERIGMPSVLGYLILGFLLRLSDSEWKFLPVEVYEAYEFLGYIGIICLLFEVGLNSNLAGLVRQLRHATVIWVGNVLFSGFLGYVTAHFLLELELIPSLFVSIAFTATSVGISVAVWQEANALNSPNGELVVDVAELDDISGIVLMALLFAVVPVMREGVESSLPFVLVKTTGIFLAKLVLFGIFCFLFSRYIEQPITSFFQKLERPPDRMITVVGIGFIIAAVAELIGFSVAIGAFFAGLVFSRDPRAVKMEGSFTPLYEFFTPFFFIGIGLNIDPATLTTAFDLGFILLIAAVLGKVAGAGGPALPTLRWTSSLLLGVSMVPRAEIAMVIMERGYRLGDWAVPPEVFGAMAVVSAATCLISPVVLRLLLKRWPQSQQGFS